MPIPGCCWSCRRCLLVRRKRIGDGAENSLPMPPACWAVLGVARRLRQSRRPVQTVPRQKRARCMVSPADLHAPNLQTCAADVSGSHPMLQNIVIAAIQLQE